MHCPSPLVPGPAPHLARPAAAGLAAAQRPYPLLQRCGPRGVELRKTGRRALPARGVTCAAQGGGGGGGDGGGPKPPSVSRKAADIIVASGVVAFSTSVAFFGGLAFLNPSCVPSSSMAPTLLPGDCVMVDVASYRLGRPSKGDVIVFRPPPLLRQLDPTPEGQEAEYVKRVVGVAGDRVSVSAGLVRVNGLERSESAFAARGAGRWAPPTSEPAGPPVDLPEVEVPRGALFVLGDNAASSIDSKYFGFLPERDVLGKAWVRYKPLSRAGLL